MSAAEDEDVKLQRASTSLLSDFQRLLPRLLQKRKRDGGKAQIRQYVRDLDVYKACILVILDAAER